MSEGKKEKINVLSLFDGMSCGQIALNKVGIEYENYFASEIDKYAIQVTQKNYPNTIQIGDITEIQGNDLSKIDLLMGGSPCQGFSFAGKQLNFEDPRSKLFFEFVRLLEEVKPKYFLLENVRMKKEYQDIISKCMGCEPIEINSKLVSAQSRPRLYWTNIPLNELKDKGVTLADVLEDNVDLKYKLSDAKVDRVLNAKRGKGFFYNKNIKKTGTLISGYYKQPTDGIYVDLGFKRRLTPTECEKLQTIPLNYTDCVSDSQRYKMIGNGWTVDVIAHIFSFLKAQNL